MSPDLSRTSISLHSDASSHETVAPPNIPVISSKNRFTTLPSHQNLDPNRDRIRSNPSWTDTFPKKKLEARARILSDWFQSRSDPDDLGVSMRPDSHLDSNKMDTPRLTTAPSHTRINSVPGTGRFSFFDDEFLNLDISAALSVPTCPDATGEQSLDALREQATSILQRMQDAYKQRTFVMHQALADRNEKQGELEETHARVNHLKIQLDGMAVKVLDQEKAMQAMAEELKQGRRLRQREDSRSRDRTMPTNPQEDDIPSLSGDESVTDSVFSHREGVESPTSTLAAPSPNLSQVALSTPTAAPTPTPTIQKNLVTVTSSPTPTRPSTYDRVMKGLASTRLGSSFAANSGNSNQCGNCHGVPASEAWSVMGILKDENRGLKTRLGELELVIDDCLGLVGP
ncbi:hypothetical protein N7526_005470 [Penicillium atrosanguineum]|nr:hypothetical protein N7526_005470 [Penicillium atrosanguineum]